jgi:hypothetical protein
MLAPVTSKFTFIESDHIVPNLYYLSLSAISIIQFKEYF